MWFLAPFVFAFIIVLLSQWIYRWRNPQCNGVLPPGSSGLPLIGETLELLIPNYSFDVHPFIKKRLQRHGPIFRTNVAGRNVVLSADQQFNRYVFQQEEKLVMRWYLDLFGKLIGEEGLIGPNGLTTHKYTKNLLLSHFGTERIKQNLLPKFDEFVHTTLKSWPSQDSLEVKSACVAMFGEFGAKELCSYDSEGSKDLTEMFIYGSSSIMAFPLNIPGTTYHKCLKDKEKVFNKLRNVVKARLASQQNTQDDLLNKMIKDMSTMKSITEEFITQLLFIFTFALSDSLANTVAYCLKFLSENPDVLRELIAEHEDILSKRKTLDSPVTWEEYKSMTFTLKVLNETLRMSNTIPGLLRRATKDIKVKGFTIPEGWGIMTCHSVMHLDPNIYTDPLKFSPWRWQDVKPEVMYKNFTPFGGGIKQCSGAEFAKASICIFLHVLVTKYRWTIVKGGDIVQNPIMRFKNGIHISVSERPN